MGEGMGPVEGARIVTTPADMKLSYNADLIRVRAMLPCAVLRELEVLPAALLTRVRNRLQQEVQQERCSSYVLYDELATQLIAAVRASKGLPASHQVHMTLGAGVPKLTGLAVKAVEKIGFVAMFTAQVPAAAIRSLSPKSFVLAVEQLLVRAEIAAKPCEAQLTAFYNQLASGQPIVDALLIERTPASRQRVFGNAPYILMPFDDSQHLKLVIFDLMPLMHAQGQEDLFARLAEKTGSLKLPATTWKNAILEDLSLARQGVEGFGVGLPLSILAASPQRDWAKPAAQRVAPMPAAAPLDLALQPQQPPAGRLQDRAGRWLAVAGDKLAVLIASDKRQTAEPLAATAVSDALVTIDAQVQRRGAEFFARTAGWVQCEEMAIRFTACTVYEGNLGFADGPLRCEGACVIRGNLEAGAQIFAAGDVSVDGHIRGGRLYTHGNLRVRGGISTGKSGVVVARGWVTSEFIENARVYSHSQIVVEKSILSSHLFALHTIGVTAAQGLIAGGRLCVGRSLESSTLGFAKGRKTLVLLGCYWPVLERLRLTQVRLQRLEAALKAAGAQAQRLRQSSAPPQEAKAQEQKLVARSERLKPLIAKLQKRLRATHTHNIYNDQAYVKVHDTLHTSVAIMVRDSEVLLTEPLKAVAVTVKSYRSSHIQPLVHFEAQQDGKSLDS